MLWIKWAPLSVNTAVTNQRPVHLPKFQSPVQWSHTHIYKLPPLQLGVTGAPVHSLRGVEAGVRWWCPLPLEASRCTALRCPWTLPPGQQNQFVSSGKYCWPRSVCKNKPHNYTCCYIREEAKYYVWNGIVSLPLVMHWRQKKTFFYYFMTPSGGVYQINEGKVNRSYGMQFHSYLHYHRQHINMLLCVEENCVAPDSVCGFFFLLFFFFLFPCVCLSVRLVEVFICCVCSMGKQRPCCAARANCASEWER